jgi:hypothetical protein
VALARCAAGAGVLGALLGLPLIAPAASVPDRLQPATIVAPPVQVGLASLMGEVGSGRQAGLPSPDSARARIAEAWQVHQATLRAPAPAAPGIGEPDRGPEPVKGRVLIADLAGSLKLPSLTGGF